MTCPICGGKTKVVDSRPEVDVVNRRRQCVECKYVFYTIEIENEHRERKKKKKTSY